MKSTERNPGSNQSRNPVGYPGAARRLSPGTGPMWLAEKGPIESTGEYRLIMEPTQEEVDSKNVVVRVHNGREWCATNNGEGIARHDRALGRPVNIIPEAKAQGKEVADHSLHRGVKESYREHAQITPEFLAAADLPQMPPPFPVVDERLINREGMFLIRSPFKPPTQVSKHDGEKDPIPEPRREPESPVGKEENPAKYWVRDNNTGEFKRGRDRPSGPMFMKNRRDMFRSNDAWVPEMGRHEIMKEEGAWPLPFTRRHTSQTDEHVSRIPPALQPGLNHGPDIHEFMSGTRPVNLPGRSSTDRNWQ